MSVDLEGRMALCRDKSFGPTFVSFASACDFAQIKFIGSSHSKWHTNPCFKSFGIVTNAISATLSFNSG